MPKTKWTVEAIQAEANKYAHRLQFAEGSRNAYTAASRKKLLDVVCKHMKEKTRDCQNRRLFDSKQEKVLADEYESGLSMRELAEKYETTATTILTTLRRIGVITRGSGEHNLGNYKFNRTEEDEMIEAYKSEKMSITKLADKMLTTTITISKIFCRRGVRLKNQSAYSREPIDLIGKKFGNLVVLERAPNRNAKTVWICKCDCGKTEQRAIFANNLLSGTSTSCGCISAGHRIDLTNKRFGRLKVLGINNEQSISGSLKWNCICDCRNEKVISGALLRGGNTKSCGCLKLEGYKLYDIPKHQQAREREHKRLLQIHGRVELVEIFRGAHHIHRYRCVDHNEVHPAIPHQVLRGDGLHCCRIANNQFDSIDKAIDGTLRSANEEEWLYIYSMKRFPKLVKIGISNNPKARATNVEYGDEISSWLFETRIDAYIVEQAIHRYTFASARIPDELACWPGALELRELEYEEAKDTAQFIIDEFYEMGRWEFALFHAPITTKQKKFMLDKHLI